MYSISVFGISASATVDTVKWCKVGTKLDLKWKCENTYGRSILATATEKEADSGFTPVMVAKFYFQNPPHSVKLL